MNNIIILGKVIEKSSIHFDYLDKLKVYFKIRVLESGNLFEVLVSEKYIGIDIFNKIYNSISFMRIICLCGMIISVNNNYIVICNDIFVI